MLKFGDDIWNKMPDEEKKLRRLLFYAHGNKEHYLYGDDGELHCNTCMCDFKRDTADELDMKIHQYNVQKLARVDA